MLAIESISAKASMRQLSRGGGGLHFYQPSIAAGFRLSWTGNAPPGSRAAKAGKSPGVQLRSRNGALPRMLLHAYQMASLGLVSGGEVV